MCRLKGLSAVFKVMRLTLRKLFDNINESVAQWLKFRVPGLEQRGAGSIPILCASFQSESARRPGG
jgi:hypothetical protein